MAGSVRNMAPNWSGDLSWWQQRESGMSHTSLLLAYKPSRNGDVTMGRGGDAPVRACGPEQKGSSAGWTSPACIQAPRRRASPGRTRSRRLLPASRPHRSAPLAGPAPPCGSRHTWPEDTPAKIRRKKTRGVSSPSTPDTHRLDVVLQEARAQSGFELVGEVLVSQAKFPVSAVPKRVKQAAIFNRHKRRGETGAEATAARR